MKADVILADPAWRYEVWNRDNGLNRSAESHYETMTTEELCNLPLPAIAAPDCALFMWATYPKLHHALEVGSAWGFEYKTVAFTWVKMNPTRGNKHTFLPVEHDYHWFMGMGRWTRVNAEICLLFTKGSPKRVAKDVRQLIVSPVGKHSAKPIEAYERIERLMGPDTVKVELFARNTREGWHSFGNEIDGKDLSESLLEVQS